MTGIIVEIKGNKMVVMNDRGDFKKLKYQEGYHIGQEIDLDGLSPLAGASLMQRAIATAALFLIVIGMGLYTYYTPYSYVNLDINPSVEIVLNRYERVLDVQGINKDGQIIVEANGEFMHDNVGNTISRLIQQAYNANYLKQDEENEIMITISAPRPKVIEGIRDEVQYYANKELERSNIISNVAVESVTIEKHSLAKKEHISAGKLLLLEQLQESSPEASVEQVKEKSVKEIKEEIKKEEKTKKQEKEDNIDTNIKENVNKIQPSKSRDDVHRNVQEDKREKVEQKDKKANNIKNDKYENSDKGKKNNKNDNNKYNNNKNDKADNSSNNISKNENKNKNNDGSEDKNDSNHNNESKNDNDNRDNDESKNKNPTPDKRDEDEKKQGEKPDERDKEKSRIQDDVYEPNYKDLNKNDEKEEDINIIKRNESKMDLIEKQGKD